MRISSTNAIEGGRVLYTIGRIEAASAWHPAHGSPLQENWRELVLRELMRKAEDIDADAIIRVDYQNDGVIRIDETGVNLKRVVATGIAVKLSCAA
jgi:Putative heavy-metal-binding